MKYQIAFDPTAEEHDDELRGLTIKPEHLQHFLLDEQIWKDLPAKLQDDLKGIQHFAAALMTSIERYKDLRAEAPYRGWPEHVARNPILNAMITGRAIAAGIARAERAYSTETSGRSETWGSPASFFPPADVWPETSTSAAQSPPESPVVSLDNPPQHPRVRRLTQTRERSGSASSSAGNVASTSAAAPTGSGAPTSAVAPITTGASAGTGASASTATSAVPGPLSGLAVREITTVPLLGITIPTGTTAFPTAAAPTSPPAPEFNEISWEFYIGQLKAEIDYIRGVLLVELRHRILGFDKTRYELGERPFPKYDKKSRADSNCGSVGILPGTQHHVIEAKVGPERNVVFDAYWEGLVMAWRKEATEELKRFKIPEVKDVAEERKALGLPM
ncbi:MAG: hypothetical protein M1821_001775 [Bathelium mastoideum]|nr:MAG: hypothetical protein M1821_001775 [Bathelium mastoideum]